jgi:hypothetical protein
MTRKNRQFLNNRLAACTSWIECQANTVLGQTIADGKKNGYGTYRLILECRNSRPAVLYKNGKKNFSSRAEVRQANPTRTPFGPPTIVTQAFGPPADVTGDPDAGIKPLFRQEFRAMICGSDKSIRC